MAIKERLLKQLDIVRDGLNAMPPFHSRDLNATRNALVQARDLCFQGLSENHFAEYKDTYDGLLLAINQLAATAPDQEEIVSLCSELLQYTITQTQKETTFKKEFFFLPYKASMWDSLESVWKAADEDKEHCITYVMPIPYADLTPQHTVAAWHCERELFPKDVPTVNWEDFDLQEIHPDVIFIHNPYDEYNRVTSVESRFYSSVLKNQTDRLVYIPYFVLDEIVPGNESVEENISGFILTPAVLNANEVIVQSENMRQVYINVLLRNTDQKDRGYWERHILGLGSPKIDKVLTSKKEDFELSESWEKIVKGKNVILYNTSLSAMLQNSDKVCAKLREVFDVFRNRKDIALWWRPHPLMKATIHSMRPEFEREYCEIEKAYIEDGWGIFDDTSDLHRAIAWSDAYYGDGSSVVQLYRETGKPVLLQQMKEKPKKYPLPWMEFVAPNGNDAWYIGNYGAWQGLFSIGLIDGQLSYYGEIPIKHKYLDYVALERIGTKIIIAPYLSAGGFLEYDLESHRFIETEEGKDIPHNANKGEVAFSNAIRYKKSVFFFSNQCGVIFEYRADEARYYKHTAWREILPDGFPKDQITIGRHCWQLIGRHLYFIIMNTNLLVKLDLDTFTGDCYEIPVIHRAWNFFIHENDFWILPRDEAGIVCWNPKTGKSQSFDAETNKETFNTYGFLPWNTGVLTLPYYDKTIYEWQENAFIKNEMLPRQWELCKDSGQQGVTFVTHEDESGRIFAFNVAQACLMQFNYRRLDVRNYYFEMNNQEKTLMQNDMLYSGYPCVEFEGIDVIDFISDKSVALKRKPREYCGHKIYDCLIGKKSAIYV